MALFQDYDIEGVIAEGGMSTVYKCVQKSLQRTVAIKVLSQELMTRYPELTRYFEQESLIMARLAHPNIVHIIDRGLSGGLPYFVMEYVDGEPLGALLRARRLDAARLIDIALQISKGLVYAHKNDVIHRDMKPANVLIDREGRALIADFGIAKLIGQAGRGSPGATAALVLGTPEYMSPEQKTGTADLAPATDIYSFGLVLFEMLTGRLPAEGMRRPSQLNPKIPSFLDGLVEQCLEPEVARRTITAELIRDRLVGGVQGAHLAPARRERAMQGITQVKEKFAVLDVLRETRFGAVYLFENRLTRQLLVIKKLSGTHRGFAESRQLSALTHPNIVRVHGVSKNDKLYIVVMDYIAGGSLLDRLVQPWAWREATAMMRAVCRALAFAHRHHIVHGNLRPSNILFTEQGEPCLTDFCLDEHYREGLGAGNWYSVPGEAPSSRADVFSAGAVFHEVLTGNLPAWNNDGRLAIDQKLRTLPVDLQTLLTRMLDRKPERRVRGFEEILPALDALTVDPRDAKTTVTRQAAGVNWTRIVWLFLLLAATTAAATLYFTGRLVFD